MYHLDDCARALIVIYMNLFINSDVVAFFFITVLEANMLCTLKCLKYVVFVFFCLLPNCDGICDGIPS